MAGLARGGRAALVAPVPHGAFEASGPDFNAAVRLVVKDGPHGLSPSSLLERLQAIELAHGRERPYERAAHADLDILFLRHAPLGRALVDPSAASAPA